MIWIEEALESAADLGAKQAAAARHKNSKRLQALTAEFDALRDECVDRLMKAIHILESTQKPTKPVIDHSIRDNAVRHEIERLRPTNTKRDTIRNIALSFHMPQTEVKEILESM